MFRCWKERKPTNDNYLFDTRSLEYWYDTTLFQECYVLQRKTYKVKIRTVHTYNILLNIYV